MALPTTSITMSAVGVALGNSSRNLSTLCTDSNINPWARYKPGYLEGDGTANNYIVFQTPQGSAYTDPRGTNTDSGTNLEVFRLGDFRGYNHTASSPYAAYPASTLEYPSTATTATGITLTFYAREINWANTGVYRETANWADFTHVLAIDASDGSIAGSATLPSINGNTSITLSAISLVSGVVVTKTYHIAFGVNSTNWSVKLGTLSGAIGIGDVKVLKLLPRSLNDAQFDDNSFTDGGSQTYTDCQAIGTTTESFSSANTARWQFASLSAFECLKSGGGYDYYRNITADWYIKGFNSSPSTEYLAKSSSSIVSNNGVNSVVLPVSGSPSTFGDGDNITLILRNLTANF